MQASASSDQPLPSQVLKGPLAHHVALDVFALNILVRTERLLLGVALEFLVQCDRFLDLCDLLEVCGIGDLQASHAKSVSPLLEVSLKRSPTPVGVVPANLALVLDAHSVQLVQPKRNWLAIPTQWQVQWVVDRPLLVVIARMRCHISSIIFHFLVFIRIFLLELHLLDSLALLLLKMLDSLIDGVAQQVVPLGSPAFKASYALVLLFYLCDELLLFLKTHLLHFSKLPLVDLSTLVVCLQQVFVEQLVCRHAEQFVLVRWLLPSGDTFVAPSLLKLLFKLLFQLVGVNQGLRS
mmetsp:Transcript_47362/g.88614  ORF Transcript_47362/g.88614 Transcript_47362/m.88614 type:complete len:294 (+) Transcript_47362:80-961(+)